MYDGFVNAAKEVFSKKVKVVIDRFHVAKSYRDSFETLRKSELKRLKNTLSEDDYKKLKNVMWVLRKKPTDLNEDDLKKLYFLFSHSDSLATAYTLRNDLTDIFNQNITRTQAKNKIISWIERVNDSELKCFDKFIVTLEKMMDDILNYFIHRYNSGFVEGLNNKVKVLKRRCYGLLDHKNLFRRLHLDLQGYSLFLSDNQ